MRKKELCSSSVSDQRAIGGSSPPDQPGDECAPGVSLSIASVFLGIADFVENPESTSQRSFSAIRFSAWILAGEVCVDAAANQIEASSTSASTDIAISHLPKPGHLIALAELGHLSQGTDADEGEFGIVVEAQWSPGISVGKSSEEIVVGLAGRQLKLISRGASRRQGMKPFKHVTSTNALELVALEKLARRAGVRTHSHRSRGTVDGEPSWLSVAPSGADETQSQVRRVPRIRNGLSRQDR